MAPFVDAKSVEYLFGVFSRYTFLDQSTIKRTAESYSGETCFDAKVNEVLHNREDENKENGVKPKLSVCVWLALFICWVCYLLW